MISHLVLTIKDLQGETIENPVILIRAVGKTEFTSLNYDYSKARKTYTISRFPVGVYQVKAEKGSLKCDPLLIRVGEQGCFAELILSVEGHAFYIEGVTKIPFIRNERLFGINFRQALTPEEIEDTLAPLFQNGFILNYEPEDQDTIVEAPPALSLSEISGIITTFTQEASVAYIGPVITTKTRQVFPNQFMIEFREGIREENITSFLSEKPFILIDNSSYDATHFMIQYTGIVNYGMIDQYNSLFDGLFIRGMFPNFKATSKPCAPVVPTDIYISHMQKWYLDILKMSKAWEILENHAANQVPVYNNAFKYGDADRIIAVVDSGIETTAGGTVITHPEFNSNVVQNNGTVVNKVYYSYDYRTNSGTGKMEPGNDNPLYQADQSGRFHGSSVSSVCLASADPSRGMVGIAPNTRLLSALYPTIDNNGTFERNAHLILHIAGFDPGWVQGASGYSATQVFPKPFKTVGVNVTPTEPNAGADLINLSVTNKKFMSIYDDAFEQVVHLGRKRRGVIICNGAGNQDDDFRSDTTFGNEHGQITIAASSINSKGKEIRGPYSNFSADTDPCIDVCAPSSNYAGGTLPIPQTFLPAFLGAGLTTAYSPGNPGLNGANLGKGYQGGVLLDHILTSGVNAGDNTITQAAFSTVDDNDIHWAFLMKANSPDFEIIAVLLSGNVANLGAATVKKNYSAGDRIAILSGDFQYVNFGGTSGATPVVTGVAALMISINPNLTWLEVREILRKTSIPIHLTCKGPLTAGWQATLNHLGWVELPNPIAALNAGSKLIGDNGLYDTAGNAMIEVIAGTLNAGSQTLVLPGGHGFNFTQRDTIRIGFETSLDHIDLGDNTKIVVNDASGLDTTATRKNIRIGHYVETTLIGVLIDPANPAQYDPADPGYPAPASGNYKYINVISTEDFKVGDTISIGADIRTINGFGINAADMGALPVAYKDKYLVEGRGDLSSTIELSANISVTTVTGTEVKTTAAMQELRTIIAKNGNELTLNSGVAGFNAGTKVELIGTEIRLIKAYDGVNTLTIDAAENTHPTPFNVTKGRRADYSPGLGYGRVDAEAAVEGSRVFSFNQRDLIIRNYLADNGQIKTDTAVNPIQSPDIWIRNANDLGAPMLRTLNPNETSLHQNPEFDISIKSYSGPSANNDLILSGNYTGSIDATFIILTDNAGGFTWQKDNGAPSPTIMIQIGPSRKHTLSDGVDIEFGNTVFVGGEQWTIAAKSSLWTIQHISFDDQRIDVSGAYSGNEEVVYTIIRSTLGNYTWSKKRLSDNTALPGGGTFPLNVAPFANPLDDGLTFTYTSAGAAEELQGDTWNISVTNNKRQIYIRVHNRGTSPSFLPSKVTGSQPVNKVRAMLYVTKNNTIPTLEHFEIKRLPDTSNFITAFSNPATNTHTLVLQEVDFRESVDKGEPNFTDSLAGINPPGQITSRIFKFAWPETAVLTRNTGISAPPAQPLRMFILAEVTPHDGIVTDPANGNAITNGMEVSGNNNISFREVFFATFSFKNDLDNGVLPHFLEVDDAGNEIITTYNAHIEAEISAFKTENVSIEITRTKTDNTTEVLTYRNNGAWSIQGNAPFWIGMDPNMPVLKGTVMAAIGNQIRITFKGTFKAKKDFKKVSIRAIIKSDQGAEIADKQHDIIVSTPSSNSGFQSGLGEDAGAKKTKFDFYSEYQNVMQVAGMEFGPVAADTTNQFNTTHLLKAANPSPNGVDAFAVTDGVVLVQQNTDDIDMVNIILKPVAQGIVDTLNIKYFVYRGILKSSLISGTDVAATGTNDLTTQIWSTQAVNSTTQEVLGYDLSATKLDSDLLETGFLSLNNFARVPVKRGMSIGKFAQNGTVVAGTPIGFGFDIIIEDVNYKPTFGEVRKGQNIITIGTGLSVLEKKIARTKVLNFIDPVAYYGLHFNANVIAPVPSGEDKLKRNPLYNDLLVKFVNRNVVYLDIRNANGLPFNHYENYGTVSQIKLGYVDDANPVTSPAVPYDQDSWPIKILKLADFTATNPSNTGKKNILRLRLPEGDNNSPTVYIALGSTFKRFPKLDKNEKRFVDLTILPGGFIDEVKLGLPNVDDAGSTTPCAWYFKIYYMVKTNNSYAAATPFVVPTNQYFDNLFNPLDLPSFFTNADIVKYMSSGREAFLDGSTDLGFAAFVKTGAALENGRITFYAVPKNIKLNKKRETRIFKDILGGSSNKPSFYEIVTNVCSGLDLRKRELQLPSGVVNYLDFADDDVVSTGTNSTFNFMGITISQGELTTLSNAISPLDPTKHPVVINVRSYTQGTDLNGNGYREIVIGLAGVDSNGNFVQPATTVTLYSSDGRFASSAAAAAAETASISDLLADMTFNNKQKEIQVYKRLKVYPQTTSNKDTWELYDDSGNIQNYGAGETDYYGNSITGQQIKLTACTRVIILGKKVIEGAAVDGNTNFYKIVCWYRNKYREGFVNEYSVVDHSKTNRVNIADVHLQVSDAIVVESFLNDARFEIKILDDMFTDTGTAGVNVKLKSLLDDVTAQYNTMVADMSGPSASTFESFYSGQIKHLTKANTLKRNDADAGATLKGYRELDTLNNLIEYDSYIVFSVGANSKLYDLVKEAPGTYPILAECFNDPGEIRNNVGANGGELAKVKSELLALRAYIENTNNFPVTDPILQSNDYLYLKEITDPPTPMSPDITSIDEATVIIILDPANWTDGVKARKLILSSFVPVDQAMGYIDSDHVFSVLINEMNVSDSIIPAFPNSNTDLVKMITDTHAPFSGDNKWLAEEVWSYLRNGNTMNDLITTGYATFDPGSLGRVIRALFFRNPEIGIIYLDQYFKALVQ